MTDVKGLTAAELMALAKLKMKEEKAAVKESKASGKRVTSYYVPDARARFEKACELEGVSESGFQFAATMKAVDEVLKNHKVIQLLEAAPEKTLAQQLEDNLKQAV